jgi:hypothetical protein
MVSVGGADETVERAVQPLAHRLEFGSELIDISLRRNALRLGGALHLLPVLVGSGHGEHVMAVEALEAGNRVCCDHLVGVADMRRPFGIGDRRRQIKGRAILGSVACHALGSSGDGSIHRSGRTHPRHGL